MESQSRSRGKQHEPETVAALEVSSRAFQGLSRGRIQSEKPMRTAPCLSLKQAAESVQSWCVHQGWGLRAGASWDTRVGDS